MASWQRGVPQVAAGGAGGEDTREPDRARGGPAKPEPPDVRRAHPRAMDADHREGILQALPLAPVRRG
eukprot:CAMPEP_0185281862 /NCGR_PEP_ID=MMETSP1359-20130426/66955_1 /TAXON_ID=552665 /ORGANISM="Bigelowiella longifila, Strain CCMP242" /LENGTH=67 /DNA_ID=CAMNT_0027877343 /DNA_START=221 /DNA_END=425 /DNA_ORIENTATION=+